MKEQLRKQHYIPACLESPVPTPVMKEFILKLASNLVYVIVDLTGLEILFRSLVPMAPEHHAPTQTIEESLPEEPALFQESQNFPIFLPV